MMRPKFLNNALRRKGMGYRLDWQMIFTVTFLLFVLFGALFIVSWIDQQAAQAVVEAREAQHAKLEHAVIECMNGKAILLEKKAYMECRMNYQMESL